MKKSELINILQEHILSYGDGPVYHDLDVGDDVIEVSQIDEGPIEELNVPTNAIILL